MTALSKNRMPDRRWSWIIGAVLVAGGLLLALMPRLRRGQHTPERRSEGHYRTGLALAGAGNGSKAVSEWRLAIAMDPADPRPYQALASFYEDAGQPALAAEMLERL